MVAPNALDDSGAAGTAQAVLRVLRWPVLALVGMVALSLLYRWGPDRDAARFRWVSPGAVLATVVWVAASIGFSIYTSEVRGLQRDLRRARRHRRRDAVAVHHGVRGDPRRRAELRARAADGGRHDHGAGAPARRAPGLRSRHAGHARRPDRTLRRRPSRRAGGAVGGAPARPGRRLAPWTPPPGCADAEARKSPRTGVRAGPARERPEDELLVHLVGATGIVAVDQVGVAPFELGGPEDVAHQDAVTKAERVLLDLSLDRVRDGGGPWPANSGCLAGRCHVLGRARGWTRR